VVEAGWVKSVIRKFDEKYHHPGSIPHFFADNSAARRHVMKGETVFPSAMPTVVSFTPDFPLVP
jgi:hypothetical protein